MNKDTESTMRDANSRQRFFNRLKLLLLIGIFIGPLLATWVYHEVSPKWRPATDVHGTLFEPVRTMPDMAFYDVSGTTIGYQSLAGRWLYLQVNLNSCDQFCNQLMDDLRQLRISLGRDQNRIQNLYLGGIRGIDQKALAREHPRLFYRFVETLDPVLQDALVTPRGIAPFYLVDPLGNLVAFYDDDYDLKQVKDDIKRLLEASVVG